MQRILVVGSGGAGKSTLATTIAERLQLPLVHLDALYWRPGWRETEKSEFARIVRDHIAAPRWVMDGNYGGTLDARIERCDAVIFLDLPRIVCLWRVVRRLIRYRGRSRPDMPAGCPERIDWEFVRWIWTYPERRRPDMLRRLASLRSDQRAIVLRSAREVSAFVTQLRESS